MYCPQCAQWMSYKPWAMVYVCPNGHTVSITKPNEHGF